jgi:hypothetical protein
MVAKCNSKTHSLKKFSVFFNRFIAFAFKVCKSAHMTQSLFSSKIQYGYPKLQNLILISSSMKKLQKMHAKKVINKKMTEK